MRRLTTKLVPVALLLAASAPVWSGTVLHADASASAGEIKTGYFHMGTAASPKGGTLGINNLYLTHDGTPWLPVMGEFHYSRSPASNWLAELQKMKSAGVDVVSSYVIWSHHEPQEGSFDWKENRDLRRFVQLADKAGLKVVLRIGPWAHAEVRYGGMPDWVVDQMRTRGNDPVYLEHVARLYGQIAAQVKGELWKDGGPVIGIQLENEYNLDGPNEGAQHIRTLKALALKAGLDAPLYTVTGWDGTVYPSGEVAPMFGGYPDEPWGTSTTELPPKETYAFRFGSRVSGDLGAQTAASAPGTAETDAADTPFLAAEYGAGLPAMYRRRTLVSPDDIASMLPVQLGSGVNLMGYYMFHGGRNPMGDMSLEESTLSGGYNDVPKISYDFQAPLGPDGQMRPVLGKLKPFHYFLNDFGGRLAPMTVRKPEQVPASPADLATPRWSVRAKGNSGFVFFNNHVRQYATAPQTSLQFSLKLEQETLRFPSKPFDAPADSYFIWPYHFDLDGIDLRYATAQPLARLNAGKDGIVYVFAAAHGIPAELAFDASLAPQLHAGTARVEQNGDTLLAHVDAPGTQAALSIARAGKPKLTLLVLNAEQAQQLSIGEAGGQRRLLLSAQQAYFAAGHIEAGSPGNHHFHFAVYPALPHPKSAQALRTGEDGMFQTIDADLPQRQPEAQVAALRPALPAAPIMRGGLAQAALQPLPEQFKAAAAWTVTLPKSGGPEDILQIDFTGDIGRLFAGTRLIDDWYYNGQSWQVALANVPHDDKLTLTVLPLRADAPIYLPREHRPDFAGQPQAARIDRVAVLPMYHVQIAP
ncbi:MAG TPA: beta-galactosidase [Burkholderiaceae bacterium]